MLSAIGHAMLDRRPRGRLRRTDYVILTLLLWTFTFFGTSLATAMGEECDWTGR